MPKTPKTIHPLSAVMTAASASAASAAPARESGGPSSGAPTERTATAPGEAPSVTPSQETPRTTALGRSVPAHLPSDDELLARVGVGTPQPIPVFERPALAMARDELMRARHSTELGGRAPQKTKSSRAPTPSQGEAGGVDPLQLTRPLEGSIPPGPGARESSASGTTPTPAFAKGPLAFGYFDTPFGQPSGARGPKPQLRLLQRDTAGGSGVGPGSAAASPIESPVHAPASAIESPVHAPASTIESPVHAAVARPLAGTAASVDSPPPIIPLPESKEGQKALWNDLRKDSSLYLRLEPEVRDHEVFIAGARLAVVDELKDPETAGRALETLKQSPAVRALLHERTRDALDVLEPALDRFETGPRDVGAAKQLIAELSANPAAGVMVPGPVARAVAATLAADVGRCFDAAGAEERAAQDHPAEHAQARDAARARVMGLANEQLATQKLIGDNPWLLNSKANALAALAASPHVYHLIPPHLFQDVEVTMAATVAIVNRG